MRVFWAIGGTALLLCAGFAPAVAQPEPDRATSQATGTADPTPRIEWEVKNRFRLFRNERDFQRHVAAYRSDGVLAAEQRLAHDSAGRGWARTMVDDLCVDAAGNLAETCLRDDVRESYLAPEDHRIGTMAANVPAGATCAWKFEDANLPPQQVSVPCEEEVMLRVRAGAPTIATLDVALPDGTAARATAEILVRDLLIAGLGDSVASGDGNPDRAVALTDEGFCFRRFFAGARSEYFRPGRAGYRGAKACDNGAEGGRIDADWTRRGARWLSAPCHRSLYGHQMRTALALAVENSHAAVTFMPLACTGATIEVGLLDRQRARETACEGKPRGACSSTVPGQLAQLRDALALARRHEANRNVDLVLLTIGANDVGFSGLIADVIIPSGAERGLFRRAGLITSLDDAQEALQTKLPADFARLRAALKPLVGGNLARVVYVSYGHPALQGGAPCPGGLDGFDVHPAFAVDSGRLGRVSEFVSEKFLPGIKALATCESGTLCPDASTDRMTFVDAHQRAFADHGFCARSSADPTFDVECFSANGDSFQKDLVEGATRPLVCSRSVAEFRPYASRARWVRTANDSYFTAMTYPEGLPTALQPTDIHDATWGATSAVYGGAIHPTAEGHAAMADAALPAVREVLGLSAPTQ